MHAFLAATTWRHQAFLRAENGDVFRVWFAGNDNPYIERLVLPRDGEYSEPVAALAKAEDRPAVSGSFDIWSEEKREATAKAEKP